jgi:pimeloyl-ACP methyl ester carboxylesterase/DNA-binding CsgD family transcriptional regulator
MFTRQAYQARSAKAHVACSDGTSHRNGQVHTVSVDQRIATTKLSDGTEIAYALAGAGPLLVYVPGWLTHLEHSWSMPPERAFYESLARGRTLLRYDKPGCGLSGSTDREASMELELETLDAVVAAAGIARFDLLGTSLGAPVAAHWAADHQDRVERLILYGGWVRGRDVAGPDVQEHVLGLISDHWGLGSDVLVDIFAPEADPPTRAAFIDYQRSAASAETVRTMLALSYRVDVTEVLARITAPTLVVHRDRDRAAPLDQGQVLAASIPGAELAVLPGRAHLPFIGDVDALVRAIRTFLGLPVLRRSATPTLTARQREVAALVSEGLTNREIAVRLHITERSAESHVERIRDRMGFRSRAQIAAWFVANGWPSAEVGSRPDLSRQRRPT